MYNRDYLKSIADFDAVIFHARDMESKQTQVQAQYSWGVGGIGALAPVFFSNAINMSFKKIFLSAFELNYASAILFLVAKFINICH